MEMINVVGLGYIGLPTALSLAVNGNKIVGTDYNKTVVDNLISGMCDFAEEGINELYKKAIEAGILFTT